MCTLHTQLYMSTHVIAAWFIHICVTLHGHTYILLHTCWSHYDNVMVRYIHVCKL